MDTSSFGLSRSRSITNILASQWCSFKDILPTCAVILINSKHDGERISEVHLVDLHNA